MNANDDIDSPREALKTLRAQLGCSQEQLARKLGVTLRTIATWERLTKGTLSADALIHLHLLAMAADSEDPIRYFAFALIAHYEWIDAKPLGCLVCSILPFSAAQLDAIQELLERWRENPAKVRA